MKKKQSTPTRTSKRLALDVEQIADLEVDDNDNDAIRGGGRSNPSGI